MSPLKFEHNTQYHIYNRGIDKKNIFKDDEDYQKFLELYRIFITPIADTYAWNLMENHFHCLVRIKDPDDIGYLNPDNKNAKDKSIKWKTFTPGDEFPGEKLKKLVKPKPQIMFSHLFNTYAKFYNKKYNRTGKLMIQPFKRKLVDSPNYFFRLIHYINSNAVHHQLTTKIEDHKWTSYHEIISGNSIISKREEVLELFNGIENFISSHKIWRCDDMEEYVLE